MANKHQSDMPDAHNSLERGPSAPPPWDEPRDIRDVFSFKLAFIARIQDRNAQALLLEKYAITLGEWRTLATIQTLGNTSLRNLARSTHQDEGLLSRIVSSLMDRELIDKKTRAGDKRGITLSLTPKGDALYREIKNFVWQMNRELLSGLAKNEQKTLVRLIDKLFDSVSKF